MATLKDKWDDIEGDSDYVTGSLILKSGDSRGAVLKWLVQVSAGPPKVANRIAKMRQSLIR